MFRLQQLRSWECVPVALRLKVFPTAPRHISVPKALLATMRHAQYPVTDVCFNLAAIAAGAQGSVSAMA